MNSTELKDYVYQKLATSFDPPLTREDVGIVFETFLDGMIHGLTTPDEEGECKVLLRGFGTLKRVTRKGRTYSVRGKEVSVGERDTVTFKPGAGLSRGISSVGDDG